MATKRDREECEAYRDSDQIARAYRRFPVLRELNRGVIVEVDRWPAQEICANNPCASNPEIAGWILGVRRGIIVSDLSWEAVREQRRQLGMRSWSRNIAQTVLAGDEDICIFIQILAKRKRHSRIGVDLFVCARRKKFSDYPNIVTWMQKPAQIIQFRQSKAARATMVRAAGF